MPEPKYRVRWVYEEFPDFSHLEQWNTPEKYYGESPKCSHGEKMVYKNGMWRGSDECDAESQVGSDRICGEEKQPSLNSINGGVMLRDGKPVLFEDYIGNEGDPEKHVALEASVERQCPDGEWHMVASVGNIDFFSSDSYEAERVFAEEDIDRSTMLPYQKEVSHDLIKEAKCEWAERKKTFIVLGFAASSGKAQAPCIARVEARTEYEAIDLFVCRGNASGLFFEKVVGVPEEDLEIVK